MVQKNILLPSEFKVISEDERKGVYEIDGLYPGYGHTLGNSIRRVILSSTPGWSVVKIKIDGVPHEFGVIEDVKEDIINIVLNLKQVVFKVADYVDEDKITLKLSKKGKGEVYAKDFEKVTGVEVVNPDQYLFTISSASKEVNIEVEIWNRVGYISKENLTKGEKLKAGEIILDTGFSPIHKVFYNVENTRVGDRTDFNKLTLTIETNGSVTPKEVLINSLRILIEQLKEIMGGYQNIVEDKDGIKSKYLNSDETIAILDLDENILGSLASAGIVKMADLVQRTDEELLKIDGIDEEILSKIKKALNK